MLGKVDLSPASGPAQLPDALPRRRTDVLCHASMIGLAFALYLAHTLFGEKGSLLNRLTALLVLACSVACIAQGPQTMSGSVDHNGGTKIPKSSFHVH